MPRTRFEIRATFELAFKKKLSDEDVDRVLDNVEEDLSSLAVFARTQRLAGPGLVNIELVSVEF